MCSVPKRHTIGNNLSRGQLDIILFDQYAVSILAQFRNVEFGNRLARFGETDELAPVQTCGVVDYARTVDDGSRLVCREQDLVRT